MASMTMTKARECPECGQVHDCAFYVEMQVLANKLDSQVNRLIDELEAQHLIAETHPLEDK